MYCTVDSRQGGFAWVGEERDTHSLFAKLCINKHREIQKRNTIPFVQWAPCYRGWNLPAGKGLSILNSPTSHAQKTSGWMKGTFFQQGKMTSRPRERRETLAQSVKVIRTSTHVKPVLSASHTSDHSSLISKTSATQPKSVLVWILVLRTAWSRHRWLMLVVKSQTLFHTQHLHPDFLGSKCKVCLDSKTVTLTTFLSNSYQTLLNQMWVWAWPAPHDPQARSLLLNLPVYYKN